MAYNLSNKLLFLDLETTSLDILEADIKFVGCMDETGECWMAEWCEEAKKILLDKIEGCGKVITFNGEAFDLPILKRYGVDIQYWQHIDLYEVYKKRAPLIRSGGFKSYKLKNIVKEIGIKSEGKGDIDYKIFQKDKWSKEEYELIYTYLKQDLVVTKELWDYLILKFDNLKDFLNRIDQNNYKHITSSTGAYGYKVICHTLGLKEEYIDTNEHTPYEGAFVMAPQREVSRGDILYLDFASLYPMMYVHSNLFSSKCECCTNEEKWQGNDMFKINGKYCSKKNGQIEELVKKFYLQRKEFKKIKDPREFAIKIILNCFSEDTEILTESGVRLLKDCNVGDMVYSINTTTGTTELKPIEKMYDYDYDGDMVHFKDKNKDLIVTPNHDVLVKGTTNKLDKIQAQDVILQLDKYPEYNCFKIIKNPTDKVICCSVKDNHTIMAGRNGNFVWTGQSIYGTSAKPSFKHLHSKYTASDCTALARQCIEYTLKKLTAAGYFPIYTDTDSVIVDLCGKDRQECLDLATQISKDLSNSFPFPWEEFNLKLEDDLDYIQFFKDKKGDLIKKNYIYINKAGKMTIKGMDIIKKNCSELAQKIFKEKLRAQILERKDCLFSKEYIDGLITENIKSNKLIIAKRFNIKDTEYKSKTSIYSLIKDMYGSGEIMMIKNNKIGAGKGVKYCSLKEADQLEIKDLDLDDIYKEMSPFIKDYHEIKLKEDEKIKEERKALRIKLRAEAKEDKTQTSLFQNN